MIEPRRPQEVCEFGEYRFTIEYPFRYPNGYRPLDPGIEAMLQKHHDSHLTNPADTQAATWWVDTLVPQGPGWDPPTYDPKGSVHSTAGADRWDAAATEHQHRYCDGRHVAFWVGAGRLVIMKKAPWTEADRQAFRDGVRIRATTVPNKKKVRNKTEARKKVVAW